MKKFIGAIIIVLAENLIIAQWSPIFVTSNSSKDICFFNLNTGVIGGYNGIMMRTTNEGLNWYTYGFPATYTIFKISGFFDSVAYAASDGGVIAKTTNTGRHWFLQNTETTTMFRGISFINANTGIAVGYSGLIRFTTNAGLTWLLRTMAQPANLYSVHLLNENTALTVSSDLPGALVLKTINAGINWSTIYYLPNNPPNTYNSLYSIHFFNVNTGLVCGSSQVLNNYNGVIYRTTNGGINWSVVASSPDNTLNTIYFFNQNLGYVVGNNGVILYTSNGGINWNAQTSGTTNSLSGVFFINAFTGYAAGNNGTVLKTTNGGITGFLPISSEIPHEFMLHQNYPNPFNPTTKIRFDIGLDGSHFVSRIRGNDISIATLKIYDVLGVEVSTLVNEQLQPGAYEVEWNASDFPSGVYYYTISAESFFQTRKMILLK